MLLMNTAPPTVRDAQVSAVPSPLQTRFGAGTPVPSSQYGSAAIAPEPFDVFCVNTLFVALRRPSRLKLVWLIAFRSAAKIAPPKPEPEGGCAGAPRPVWFCSKRLFVRFR